MATTTAVAKRASGSDVTLMPPPPVKRIKRPPKVLDEDDYTDALSDIIARDYFPGLEESKAQGDYLAALESGNQIWIAEASHKLRAAIDQKSRKPQRVARDTRYDSAPPTPHRMRAVTETPRGYDGSQTPMSTSTEAAQSTSKIDTSAHSLSSFQAKYTSEDNASFNDVLDSQNKTRREKHAYLWTNDQAIPSARQIAHRAREQILLTDKEHADAEAAKHGDKALIPLTTGAVATRSAKPDAWKVVRPDNPFMFFPDSVDETQASIPTIQEQKESDSKAGPKETVHANTRFPSLSSLYSDPGPSAIPSSPSLNTEIIANRDSYDGTATPRVNGYAFVDEDEPDPDPPPANNATLPSYRDLLAGQTASPFRFSTQTKREALHHRLVEKSASAKRNKERETIVNATPVVMGPAKSKTPSMTPAAARLLDRVGKTPVRGKVERMSSKDMWTPTPRKPRVGK